MKRINHFFHHRPEFLIFTHRCFSQNNCLRIIDPALPESINNLSFHNLRIGGTILDLEFERVGSTTACRVAKKRGNLRVVIEA